MISGGLFCSSYFCRLVLIFVCVYVTVAKIVCFIAASSSPFVSAGQIHLPSYLESLPLVCWCISVLTVIHLCLISSSVTTMSCVSFLLCCSIVILFCCAPEGCFMEADVREHAGHLMKHIISPVMVSVTFAGYISYLMHFFLYLTHQKHL